jgi:hypothetical protein
MAEILKLRLGSAVLAEQQRVGVLTRFLIDNESYRLTHLDVAEHGYGRLVPIGDVATADAEITLSTSAEQFAALPPDEQVNENDDPLIPAYDPDALVQGPVVGLWVPITSGLLAKVLPEGEVDLDRHVPVHASDGHVGHADGLVADRDGELTHLLLAEGHIFGKREVAVPIDVVESVSETGVQLKITKDELEALPSA